MRVFLAVFVVLVMLFVSVTMSISSTPAETCVGIEMELERASPEFGDAERVACAACSETHTHHFMECIREAKIASTAGTVRKLPTVAVANGDERNAHEAANVKVETINVGARS